MAYSIYSNTLVDIAVAKAQKQGGIVDKVTETSPIIQSAPFFESTHGISHTYEDVKSINGGSFVDIDGELVSTDMISDLEKQDLSVLGGKVIVGEDRARQMGGRDVYFAKKSPYIMKETTSGAEEDLIYNVLEAYAIRNGNVVDIGGSAGTNYSILCVRWEEDNCSGLYDPQMFNPNTLYDMEMLYDGSLADYTVGTKTVTGYGMRFKAYMSFLLANPRNVSVMVNIDPANSKLPTGVQMDELLVKARVGSGGNSFLYMHPLCKAKAINQFKGDALQTFNTDSDFNRFVEAYGRVPIVESYNFKDATEANV